MTTLALWLLLAADGASDGGVSPPALEPDPTRYWADQSPRPFVSGHVAAGFLNRVMVAGGYGRPHWLWGGGEVQVLSTTEFFAVYGGLRAELLAVNVMAGVRGTFAYGRRLPALADTYDEASLVDPGAPHAFATSVDVSLWGYVPAGPTLGYWELTGVWVPARDAARGLFDEYLRFTLNQNVGALARLAWSLSLWGGRLLIGPSADVALTPGRSPLVRVGGGASVLLTRHLTLSLSLTAPVTSPDSPGLGWFTQSWGLGRVTWTWASDEPEPGWR